MSISPEYIDGNQLPQQTSTYKYKQPPLPTHQHDDDKVALPPLPSSPHPRSNNNTKISPNKNINNNFTLRPRLLDTENSNDNQDTNYKKSPRTIKRHNSHFFPNGTPPTLRVELINKKLSNESQQRAWDHYLNTRPIRDEQTDQPLGFEMDPVTGDVLRNPKTGEPKWSCCKCNSSIRSVHFNEFSDLGPGLALTFRLMQVGWKFFILAFLLSSVGWVIQLYNPKDITWVNISWICDLLFTIGFAGWMCWLRRDMALHEHEVDEKDITASDYTVQISNLPADVTAKELNKYFSQFGLLYTAETPVNNMYDNTFDHTGISIVRNDAAFITATFALKECKKEITEIGQENILKMKKLKKKYEKLEDNYQQLKKKTYNCSGTAFVTYMYQNGRDSCLQGMKSNHFDFYPTLQTHVTGNQQKPITKATQFFRSINKTRKHTSLNVCVATDPNDLLWRNLSNTTCNIRTRQCLVGTFSFFYLFGISVVMAFFAAHAREWQVLPGAPINLGLLAVLGNVLCFVTTIVLFMPLLSVLEGVHTRSTLQIIAFLKLSFFQFAATAVGTVYVYGLDEIAADGRAFTSSQIQSFGSGLPTSNCNIPRFNRFKNVSAVDLLTINNGFGIPPGMKNVYDLDSESCFAFTLHLFGSSMGGYLIGALIADILLINMLDLLCPPWIGEVILSGASKIFQKDLNALYEGVDQQPFLRYQILIKFLMLGLFFGSIERIGYIWVAVCFWQCLEIDRYCYVRFYNKPPFYNHNMINIVIIWVMPLGLLLHIFMHIVFFALDWSWQQSNGLTVVLRDGPIPVVALLFLIIIFIFLIIWMFPFEFWKFNSQKKIMDIKLSLTLKDSKGKKLRDSIAKLTFRDALIINKEADCVDHDLTHFSFIDVRKYIPDQRRRGFGVLKLN